MYEINVNNTRVIKFMIFLQWINNCAYYVRYYEISIYLNSRLSCKGYGRGLIRTQRDHVVTARIFRMVNKIKIT